MFGKFRRKKKEECPSTDDIVKIVCELADEYGYGDIWLYGNYYEGIYSPWTDAQIMIDPDQKYPHINGFMDECYQKLGVNVFVDYKKPGPKTEYVMANSRLIHRAKDQKDPTSKVN